MTLAQAFEVLNSRCAEKPPFSVMLACGFTPLHLRTFLAANLAAALPDKSVNIQNGLFGDLAGTLEKPPQPETASIVIALEWTDLDPRLGYRRLGGWGPSVESEFFSTVTSALARLKDALARIPETIPVVISGPTLPLAPAFHTASGQAGSRELQIRALVAAFLAELAGRRSVAVANEAHLLEMSPVSCRHDLRADLLSGFPYTISHASALGALLSRLLQPPSVRKGVITDLDNTLWSGIAGELGPTEVSWDLAGRSHVHALYQQQLQALANQGVFIAAASKSQQASVEQVFTRADLLVSPQSIFPVEAHWGPKSESVARILQVWNVGPADVVFIDDDPMELAEVKSAWPEIECMRFPFRDYPGAEALLQKLRDACGKANISQEDLLRLASIKGSVEARSQPVETQESFLAEARARIEIQFNPPESDDRILELVNKTNQFNLNGVRCNGPEWHADLSKQGVFVMAVSYADRFGPLGRIAVLKVKCAGKAVDVTTWVMSCRAFSRRIEHRCLQLLFELFRVDEVRLGFAPTPRNQPMREMLRLYLDAAPDGPVTISEQSFRQCAPKLYQEVAVDRSLPFPGSRAAAR